MTAFAGRKVHCQGTIPSDNLFFFFFLENTAFLGKKCITRKQFQAMTFFCLEITLNPGQKWFLNTMILALKIRISHRILFLPEIQCMSYTLTIHKIPNFMTWFWHANCMTSLRGHCTPLM